MRYFGRWLIVAGVSAMPLLWVATVVCINSFNFRQNLKDSVLTHTSVDWGMFKSEEKMNSEGVKQLKFGTQKEEYDEGSGYKYLIYKPDENKTENGNNKYPLLVFLHGAGESGSGPAMEIITEGASGCPPVELHYDRAVDILARSFVVVSPRTNHGWSDDLVGKLVQNLLQQHELDPMRIYLTGVSMGGAGVWASVKTGQFAAIAPVCAYGNPPTEDIADVGVWAFHGGNDIVVPATESDAAISSLRKRYPNKDVRYTRYENSPHPIGWPTYLGHASWIQAYGDKDPVVGGTVYKGHNGVELFTWFLSQKKGL